MVERKDEEFKSLGQWCCSLSLSLGSWCLVFSCPHMNRLFSGLEY